MSEVKPVAIVFCLRGESYAGGHFIEVQLRITPGIELPIGARLYDEHAVAELRAENERLRGALQAIVDEVSDGLVPYSSDSYLPAHLVEQARASLGMGGLSND